MKSIYWRGYRIIAWTIVGILIVLAIYAGISQSWQNGLVLGGFAVATACYLAIARSTPAVFAAFLSAAVAINAAGWSWNLFESVWGFDEVAHALGTLGATLIVGWHGYHPVLEALRRHAGAMALAIIALGVCLGALWEALEWAGYKLFTAGKITTLDDKISDILFDTLGALGALALFRWALSERTGEPTGEHRRETQETSRG